MGTLHYLPGVCREPDVRVMYLSWPADNEQLNQRGIHILNPNATELQKAKLDAKAKGFSTIYVYKEKEVIS